MPNQCVHLQEGHLLYDVHRAPHFVSTATKTDRFATWRASGDHALGGATMRGVEPLLPESLPRINCDLRMEKASYEVQRAFS
jgi:hypothetical protein